MSVYPDRNLIGRTDGLRVASAVVFVVAGEGKEGMFGQTNARARDDTTVEFYIQLR